VGSRGSRGSRRREGSGVRGQRSGIRRAGGAGGAFLSRGGRGSKSVIQNPKSKIP